MAQKSQKTKSSKAKPAIRVIILRNVAAITIAFLLIVACQKSPGYHWVYNDLLKGNMEIFRKYKNTTTDQRYEMKLGFSYVYLRFIKNQTPDTAVILMPEGDVFYPKNEKSDFTGEIRNKLWTSRFLYPRKIIYDKERKEQDKITHVAIANYWGYDKLPYKVSKQEKHTVLPITLPNINH